MVRRWVSDWERGPSPLMAARVIKPSRPLRPLREETKRTHLRSDDALSRSSFLKGRSSPRGYAALHRVTMNFRHFLVLFAGLLGFLSAEAGVSQPTDYVPMKVIQTEAVLHPRRVTE